MTALAWFPIPYNATHATQQTQPTQRTQPPLQ